ncbi:winged helix-turn-helix domain-containing protein [Natranaerobius trueperi]|uniref:winged helix-turn-helix domain-containing protein n=1 Tax=Natranaerobius trueperi TaxID=759412 RepID=UPI0013030731|nr:winged helix-turn-helix domain-containing protein [Natranaerobius trueperi]
MKLHNDSSDLLIYTLGGFTVYKKGVNLTQEKSQSIKSFQLLKYLIAHRDKRLKPEQIVSHLWPDNNYSNPKSTMYSHIYRLRNLLGKDKYNNHYILSDNGFYKWNKSASYWLDIEELEKCLNMAKQKIPTNLNKAIKYYRTASHINIGNFLPEDKNDWTSYVRNYYLNMYKNTTLELTDRLQNFNRIKETKEFTQKAIEVFPFEEKFYYHLTKSLIKEGKVQKAKDYFENTKKFFVNEFGSHPSFNWHEIDNKFEAIN